MICPKCGSEERDVSRFCRRCHNTLRFVCPACANEQRHGGKCDECGVDFVKYIAAVIAAKQAEADAVHERIEQRSNLMKHLFWTPFTMGIPLLRSFFLTPPTPKKITVRNK
jgi:hypothetical protein